MNILVLLGAYSVGWLFVLALSKILDLSRWGLGVGPLYVEWSTRLPNWDLSGRLLRYLLDFGIVLSVFFSGIGIYVIFSGLLGALMMWGRTTPTVAPPIPGLTIRLDVPTIAALAVALTVHELGHAIAASAEGIRAKRIAFFLLFIQPGAYVELEEEDMTRKTTRSRARVFSAGVLSNAITAGALLLIGLILLSGFPTSPSGVYVEATVEGGPSYGRILPGDVIMAINGDRVSTPAELLSTLSEESPGSIAIVRTLRGDIEVELGSRPDSRDKAWLGVLLSPFGYYAPRVPISPGTVVSLVEFLLLSFVFNLSAAALNALPALPLDMGKVLEDLLRSKSRMRPATVRRVIIASSAVMWSAVLFDLIYSLLWVARLT